MQSLERFLGYFEAFECTYRDDDWSRLEPFFASDVVECVMHRRGWPTRSKIMQLHRSWFEGGNPLVVELRE